jgi:hypothetical protein
MTTLTDRYPDLLAEGSDTELEGLVASLDTVRHVSTLTSPPERCNRVVLAMVRDQTTGQQRAGLQQIVNPKGPRRTGLGLRRLVPTVVVTAALAVGGVGAYLRLQAPASVSAAEILHRAAVAAQQATADQVIHEVSIAHVVVQPKGVPPAPETVTYDQWSQTTANGGIAREALRYSGGGSGGFVADAHGVLWTFDSPGGTISKSSWTPGTPLFQVPPGNAIFLLKSTVEAPQDPGGIRELVKLAQSGTDTQTQLLPQQSIDGKLVDVVRITQSLSNDTAKPTPDATKVEITVSIDASNSLIRNIDERTTNAQDITVEENSLRVIRYDVLSPSQIPPGVFTFTPPSGSHVITYAPPPGGSP